MLEKIFGICKNKCLVEVLPKTRKITEQGLDLNDFITEGRYFFPSASVPLNIPDGSTGWLEVRTHDGNIVKQIWYRYGTNNIADFNTYVRTRNVYEEWSDWQKFIVEEELEKALEGKSDTDHNHDDKYYTEAEMNTKLANYKLKGDFAVITGSVTIENGTGSVNVNYPSGFKQNNCVPIAGGTKYSANLNRIAFGGVQGTFYTGVYLNSGNITFAVSPFETGVGPSGTYNYKIVLMKV